MAQNVTIPGGTNTKNHATGQGVTKSGTQGTGVAANATGQGDHAHTVKAVDATQQKHKQGQQA